MYSVYRLLYKCILYIFRHINIETLGSYTSYILSLEFVCSRCKYYLVS